MQEYASRIHRVQDYIERNLESTLTIKELAHIACFSAFHFHRIFRAMTGETLGQFICRLRIEKAATKLVANPKLSITTIALECGFSSSATFARAFREAFTMSASAWREGGYLQFSTERKAQSNPGKTVSKQWQDSDSAIPYLNSMSTGEGASPNQQLFTVWRNRMSAHKALHADVTVGDLPEMTVAYVRHVGPYKGDLKLFEGLWGPLMRWAGPRGFVAQPDVKMLSVYHDDPEVTDESKLRVSVCITVPPNTQVDGEVGLMTIPAGACAMARFELDADQYGQAWDYVFGHWLPQSGYQPDDRLCFEWYLNDPHQHPQHKHIVKICVPVKPL
jgi:AraC family transcriptional regulator